MIDVDQVNTDNIQNTVAKIQALSTCLIIYHILCAIILVLGLFGGCALLYYENSKHDDNEQGDDSYQKKEVTPMEPIDDYYKK